MSFWNKIKNWFTEDTVTPRVVTPRAINIDPGFSVITDRFVVEENDSLPTRKLKGWVSSALASAPWLALAVILFGIVSHGAIATAALGYGLLKVSIAVLLTVIADETMFRGMKDHATKWLPMLRRTGVFMGICWLMAVT